MSDYEVVEAMIRYGGSFIKALGRAWQFADDYNQRRLREAFADYFSEYRELAESAASAQREET